MDAEACRQHLAQAVIARLATVRPDGKPHIVPITFAIDGDAVFFAVDAKPKRTRDLERLKNIAANPKVSLLVDRYEDDWTKLWWVRVDGTARIVEDGAVAERGLDLLVKRYPQYRHARPGGPVVAISIDRISGWSAA